jgi:23S rRNA A2030 N6-methylase RlmJ
MEQKEAERVARKEAKKTKEAKKADKKAKLLAANAAAMELNRKAKEAIKKNSIDHSEPVITKITPEQIAAAELREKERLRQLELEEKAAKKALRELKNKTKGKKITYC